jgi:tRNA uridine 5-carboxymethylaminomethyl modification enzyme
MSEAKQAAEVATLTPDRDTLAWLQEAGIAVTEKTSIAKLMQRHDLDLDGFLRAAAAPLPEMTAAFCALGEEESEGVVSRLRYAGYIERQEREAARLAEDENLQIPRDMRYSLPGLSREIVEKLTFVRPLSLGQASRISGVTPAAIAILRMHLRRGVRVAATA